MFERAAALQLSPSTACKNSFLFNPGSKYLLCDRTEGHDFIATVRRLELRFCSRFPKKGQLRSPKNGSDFARQVSLEQNRLVI